MGGEPHIELAESMQDGGAEALMPPPQDSGAGWEEPPPELRLVAAGAVPAANQQGMVLAQPAADPMQLDAHHALWAAAAAPNPLLLVPRARSEWELDPQKITLGRRLAVGGFAEVFVGKVRRLGGRGSGGVAMWGFTYVCVSVCQGPAMFHATIKCSAWIALHEPVAALASLLW